MTLLPPSSADSLACPSCGDRRRVRDDKTGEVVCPSCGLVVESTSLDVGPTFARSDDSAPTPTGHGPPQAPYAPRRAAGSTFNGTRDGQGHTLPASRQREFQILRRRAREGAARQGNPPGMSLKGEEIIRRLVQTLALPPLILDASLLVLAKGGENRLFRGRSAASAAAASVYAACRRYSLPRTWSEVARAAGISRAEFGRAYMALRRGLNLDLPPVGLGTYVRRFSTELKLSSEATVRALNLLDHVHGHPDASGVSPNGLVGAALYMASVECGEPRRQTDIARVAQVTDVTLRHAFRRLGRILGRLPP